MVVKGKTIGIAIAVAIVIVTSVYLGSQNIQHTTVTSTQNNTVTVKVAYNKLIDSLPFFVAEEEGYFKKDNINIVGTAEQDGSLVTAAMLSGQADVGFPVTTSDILLIEQREPGHLKVFLGGAETQTNQQFCILVKPNSPYKTMNDLEGKKIATVPGSVGIIYPKMMFKKYFDPNKITYVQMSPTDWTSALTSGQVDAVWSVEPLSTIMLNSGVAKCILHSAMANSVTDPFVSVEYAFSTKFINQHPETAQKMVGAIDEALTYMNNNPNETRNILAKYADLPQNLSANLGWSQYKSASDDESGIQDIADEMYSQGFLNSTVNVKNLIYSP